MATFKEFISFDYFITKDVMTLVYCLGAILITMISVIIIIWGRMPPLSYGSAGQAVVVAITWFLVGNFFWRLFCELFVVLFKINDSLISINRKTPERVI